VSTKPASKTKPAGIDLGIYAEYDRLLFDLPTGPGGGVLRITLNDPDKFNATDAAVHLQLSRIFRTIHDDESVRAVVVTGAGRAFSAGGDLDWISEQVGDYAQTMRVMKEAGDIVRTMIECDTPIVSAGLAVALMADVSIMNESAKLTDGHIRLGVGAGDHAVAIWPLLCGMAKAKYYLLTADFVDGKEAERIGLVSKAVPADDVMATALEVANKLAAGPVDATRLTKRALNHWIRQALPNFEASLAYEMLNFLGPDAAEGLAALKEKRAPNFHQADETAD
jgi:enoyl-CoA hydratase